MFIGLGFKFDTIPSKSFRLAEASRTRNRPSSNHPMPRVISPIASDAFNATNGALSYRSDQHESIKTAGQQQGTAEVVEQGLSGSELIIVQGLENVRPGVPVQASPMPQSLNRS
jgi:membrane fusion protein (multidrug efflux system)